jgi:hypothetical protein
MPDRGASGRPAAPGRSPAAILLRVPRRSPRPLLLALLACAALFSGPLAASAHAEGSLGGSSLTEQAESQVSKSSTKTTTAASKESSSESSTSSSTILVATIAAVALLIGIGFVIVRDARRRAPVSDADLDAAEHRVQHDRSEHMRRRRAKSKAARQQRKKNR